MRFLVALFVLVTAAAHAEPRCTRGSVRVDNDHKRLEVALSNSCESLVTCKVSWRLTCGHEATQERTEDLRIDGRHEEHVFASASACGDSDWYIAPPKWRCEEIITDGEKPARKRRER